MTDDKALRDELADKEYFYGHACLTGDCPHEKGHECFTAAFKAGYDACDAELTKHLALLEESIRHPFKVREDKLRAEVAELRADNRSIQAQILDRWEPTVRKLRAQLDLALDQIKSLQLNLKIKSK